MARGKVVYDLGVAGGLGHGLLVRGAPLRPWVG